MATAAQALTLAVDHHAAGRLAEAGELYRRILDADPDQPDANHLLGVLSMQQGDDGAGVALVDRALAAAPDRAPFHLSRGKALLRLGRGDEALNAFAAALTRGADRREGETLAAAAARFVAEQAFDAAAYDKALLAYRLWLALAPDAASAVFDVALTLRRLNRPVAAAVGFARLRRLAPDVSRAADEEGAAWNAAAQQIFTQAMDLLRAERRDAAIAAFRRLSAILPAAPEVWRNLSALAFARFDWAGADRFIERALRLDRTETAAWTLAGKIAVAVGDGAKGFAMVRRALALDPVNADALCTAALSPFAGAGLIWARRALAVGPITAETLAAAGDFAAAGGDEDAAAAYYHRLIRAAPGYAAGFTGLTLLELRRAGIAPPSPRIAAGPTVSFRRLGREGRFGNQLLQYAAARLCADRQGLTLTTPMWPGRALFGLDDPLCGGLGGADASPAIWQSTVREDDVGAAALLSGAVPLAGRDLFGFFCGDVSPMAAQRDAVRRMFAYAPAVVDRLGPLRARTLGLRGAETLAALHLRRGDFGGDRFWIAPEAWYLSWLREIWPGLRRPALYLATDAPELAAAFAEFRPLVYADVADALPSAPFIVDWHLLRHADALAISNSSFSYAAAMTNERADLFMRPDREQGRLRQFDPWREAVLL